MSATISVVMPVYNVERYLAEAIESICCQTCQDFEFIVIDDGSTDGSLEILKKYEARDQRIRLISRPNTGIAGALNDGLAAARGEFIARMDADDLALPHRFEHQLLYLRQHPECVAVGCQALVVDPDGWPIHVFQCPLTHEDIDGQHMKVDNEIGVTALVHPAVMLRRQPVEAVGGYRAQYQLCGEDLDLWLRLAEVGRLANLPEVLLHYRRHPQSLSFARSHLVAQLQLIWNMRKEAHERRNLRWERLPPAASPWKVGDSRFHWAEMAWHAENYATARKHSWSLFRQTPSWKSFRLLVKANLGPAARPVVGVRGWLRARRRLA